VPAWYLQCRATATVKCWRRTTKLKSTFLVNANRASGIGWHYLQLTIGN